MFYPNPNPNSNLNSNSNPDLLRYKAAQLLNGGKGSDSTNICILYKIGDVAVTRTIFTCSINSLEMVTERILTDLSLFSIFDDKC